MITNSKLDFWIKNNYNVIFSGKRGVGKSSIVIDAFERNNLKWLYFSASTMDPWVDFVGVPKEKVQDGKSYLDLVRPKVFQDDNVEALFFDEFNRSSKKVRNSVMELIQFKSINGKKFNNLKIVWAAINPEDDEDEVYDVEKLDPAQIDRFHVRVDIPYSVSSKYFKDKYEEAGESAVDWWKRLPKDQKLLISPRRLDYAVDIFKKGGDVKDVLGKKVKTSQLVSEMLSGSFTKKVKALFDSKDKDKAKEFLSERNNFNGVHALIVKKNEYIDFFLPLMKEEDVVSMMITYPKVQQYVGNRIEKYKEVAENIVKANLNQKLVKFFRAKLKILGLKTYVKGNSGSSTKYIAAGKKVYPAKFEKHIKINRYSGWSGHTPSASGNTQDRKRVYDWLENHIPEQMTENQAALTIDALTLILNHSHDATLEKLPNLVGMLNQAFFCYATNHGVSNNDLDKKIGKIYSSKNKYLTDNGFIYEV